MMLTSWYDPDTQVLNKWTTHGGPPSSCCSCNTFFLAHWKGMYVVEVQPKFFNINFNFYSYNYMEKSWNYSEEMHQDHLS